MSRRSVRHGGGSQAPGPKSKSKIYSAKLGSNSSKSGTRNRLLHTPRGGKRSRTLTISGNISDQVFTNLVREDKPLSFLTIQEIADIQREAARLKAPRLVTPKTCYRNGLQTSLSPELLHKRLHPIHRDAKTA